MSPPKVVFDTKIYHPNIGTPNLKPRQLRKDLSRYLEEELVTSPANEISVAIYSKFVG